MKEKYFPAGNEWENTLKEIWTVVEIALYNL